MHNQEEIIAKTSNWVRQELSNDTSGHDWFHIERVAKLAKVIAIKEDADLFICEMAALLHDMIDDKLVSDTSQALQDVKNWLSLCQLEKNQEDAIISIITSISYKGGHGNPITSLEAKVVQDADRLDAIGAIGIARCMAYSGYKGRLIHDPTKHARENLTFEEYRNGQDTAIMHFYEKLLKLKDLMNTDYAKLLANRRHQFMESYLEEFYLEWEGKK